MQFPIVPVTSAEDHISVGYYTWHVQGFKPYISILTYSTGALYYIWLNIQTNASMSENCFFGKDKLSFRSNYYFFFLTKKR